MKLGGQEFSFDGKLSKEPGKPALGTLARERQMFLAKLEPTRLQSFDKFELNKEIVGKGGNDAQFFTAAGALLQQAAAIDDRTIGQVFSIGSESQRAVFLQSLQGHLDGFLSLLIRHFRDSPPRLRAALSRQAQH